MKFLVAGQGHGTVDQTSSEESVEKCLGASMVDWVENGSSEESEGISRVPGIEDVGGAHIAGVEGDSPMWQEVGVPGRFKAVQIRLPTGGDIRREIAGTQAYIVRRAVTGRGRRRCQVVLCGAVPNQR